MTEPTYQVKAQYIQHELRQNDRISTYYHIIPTQDLSSAFFVTAWGDLFTKIAMHLEHKPETLEILSVFWPSTVRYLMNTYNARMDDWKLMYFDEGFDDDDPRPIWLFGRELDEIPLENEYSYFSDYTQPVIEKLMALSAGLMMELDNEAKIYQMLRAKGLADSRKPHAILELLPKKAIHQAFELTPADFRTLVDETESPWLAWVP